LTETLYRVFGVIVGLGLAVITALLEVGLSPVTWPGSATRMPISVLIAVVANFGLVYLTKYVTGSVGLAFVPAIGWFAVLLMASNTTGEGDLLIPANNYVGVFTLFLGSLAWAVAAYRLLMHRRPPAPPAAPTLPRNKARTGR
jgi:hypothetical protein